MPYDRYMIAPLTIGLETDLRPWLIPDQAFAQLLNAYVFRGRVRKRFGSYLMNGTVNDSVAQQYSRLRIGINTTDAFGDASGTVPGYIFTVGQMFTVGDDYFTVDELGTPGTMLSTGAGAGTFDTTTGAYVIADAMPNMTVYYYPAQPVMGLLTYELPMINDQPTYAFDTQFCYQFTGTAWDIVGPIPPAAGSGFWTGNDSQFFDAYTYRGIFSNERLFFVTNYNAVDLIKYYDITTNEWTNFNPIFDDAGDTIESCRIILGFHDRLIFLSTIENIDGVDNTFVNRCRYSVNGDPTGVNAWREDIPGQGGYIDNQSTEEEIISAEFLKDRLIVYFERSTWELVYTGNEILPFRWQQINTELGSESTYSIVPFDKVTLGIGNVGIHACNGANVERIDEKIPYTVFQISNDNNGTERVYGIRDYYTELVYWTMPIPAINGRYPNQVLVFNYRTGSWAINNDSITAFGYFNNVSGVRWEDIDLTWQESVQTWSSATLQNEFRQIIAGNQEGFTFIIDADSTRNAPALTITDITYPAPDTAQFLVITHNLQEDDFITIENPQGINQPILAIYQVDEVIDNNHFTVVGGTITGTYTGGGTIARVSRIDILSKQYNPYMNEGRNVYIAKVDFYVDKTANGAITIDYFPSATNLSMITAGTLSNSILGTGVLETSPYTLYPLEQVQERIWHPVYLQTQGETIQLHIYLSDNQMLNSNIAFSDFQLHAMTLYTEQTSTRLE